MIKRFLVLILLISVKAGAQNIKNDFHHLITEERGDLNKDGFLDLVRVTQDTIAATRPYRLQVFFNQPNGKQQLIVTTDQVIEAEFPNGRDGLRSEAGFDTISIKNNVIIIRIQLTRGMFMHKFRFQQGNFELIGFTMLNSDGLGTMYEEDFNLSTGMRFFKEERYDTGDVTVNRKEKKLIRPLPKLQDFVPFENDF